MFIFVLVVVSTEMLSVFPDSFLFSVCLCMCMHTRAHACDCYFLMKFSRDVDLRKQKKKVNLEWVTNETQSVFVLTVHIQSIKSWWNNSYFIMHDFQMKISISKGEVLVVILLFNASNFHLCQQQQQKEWTKITVASNSIHFLCLFVFIWKIQK